MTRSLSVVDAEIKHGDPGLHKADAPALGFSIQCDLGAGRVGVFQTHLANDCSQVDLNRMVAKMNAAGDVARAHYKIEEEEKALEGIERDQRQHSEDLAKVDKDFHVEQQARLDEVGRRQMAHDGSIEALRHAHDGSGRRQAFELKGRDLGNANTVQSAIDRLKDEILSKQAEYDDTHRKYEDLKARRAELIDRHTREIERLRAVVKSGLD